jgi:uncharacterized protein (DUF952 family)
VLVGVVLAKEKLSSGWQLGAYASCSTAAIATIGPGQFGTCQSCVHGFSVLVHSLSQTFGVFALFPDRYQVCRFSPVPNIVQEGSPHVTPAPPVLVHMCATGGWSNAQKRGLIHPDPSGGVDFIHLSTIEQVHLPANRLYRGRDDLLLLYIDPALLDAPVRWEPGVPTDPQSMLFPHLYGPLPVSAVIRVTAYRPGPDGEFAPLAEP